MLLPIALTIEGLPGFSAIGWGFVLWLAVINTACVYALYNHALKVLAAFELSVILNLIPLVTAFLALSIRSYLFVLLFGISLYLDPYCGTTAQDFCSLGYSTPTSALLLPPFHSSPVSLPLGSTLC